jgi:hypothetical protein
VNRYIPASERLMTNHELLERAGALAKQGKIYVETADGQRLKVKAFGGTMLAFPRVYHTFGYVEISWTLLQRVAEGKTKTILI